MAVVYDIARGDGTGKPFGTGSLLLQNGDLVIGESDQQHVQDTIIAYPGYWKEYPADGVGIYDYQGSSNQQQVLSRAIKIQLQSDGYDISPLPEVVYGVNGEMKVNPNATRL